MTKKEIENKIIEIFKIEFPYFKEINSDTNLTAIKEHDLDKKEFLMQVEEFFELRLAPRNLQKINTIGDLANHIYKIY